MKIHEEVLQPVVTLAAWTMVMWVWMYATRLPAIFKAKIKLDPEMPRGEQMALLPARVRWKADNYNHLMEQPTLFYAVAVVLSLKAPDPAVAATLAWAYVGLRIVHSFVQALVNKIEARFMVFLLSSLVLIAMIFSAANGVF